MATLTSLIIKQIDNNKRCLSVFLDLKKAFDTVSVRILLQKLERIGVRGTPLKLLEDYLSDRRQSVKVGQYISDGVNLTYGVPQGSVLGPTLFLININALCNLKLAQGEIFSYADDTAMVFAGDSWEDVHRKAEIGLIRVADWLKNNLLTLNATKTNYICFSINKKTQPASKFNIKIHNCSTPEYNNCNCININKIAYTKYLGVMIDQHLNWQSHLELVENRVRKLTWIFKILKHVASFVIIRRIYLALAQSVITYCISVWGGAPKTRLLAVERAQRFLIKVMLSKPPRFPTFTLYKISNLLSVRKLYILNVVLRTHRTLKYADTELDKRRKNIIAPINKTRTTFGRRQLNISSELYNQINKKLNIYSLNYFLCKQKLVKLIH